MELIYPKTLEALARYINQPHFPHQFWKFLYTQRHPKSESHHINFDSEEHVHFDGKIYVYHSAVARFYMHQVVYAVLAECTVNAFAPAHHGIMMALAVTPSLLRILFIGFVLIPW